MCLGIPMRIEARDGLVAHCEAKGIRRDVSLFLLQHDELGPGDHVMVHVGYAIQKMTEAEAASAWELFDEIEALEAAQAAAGPHA
ncbi:MAG: HypC/HybG/HupF family hydrogenase formation chaperone [Pseudomonadota bacterium]|nr:HypC/HybG/HupF family hydrogenase formation chaperone [Pseudomonadota bacterium]